MKKIILILTLFLSTCLAVAQEGFEGSATNLPAGWNQYQNAVGLTQFWNITTSSALVCFGNNAAQVNRENLGFVATPLTSEDYLVTPLYNVPANGQFRFTSRQGTLGDQGGKYQLKISTNPDKTILSAYVLLKEWTENEMNTISNVCQEQKFSIPASYTGQAVYLALVRVVTQTTTAIVGDRWVVDNVDLVSECLPPTAVNSSGIAGTSASLNWTNPSGGPQWGIAYVANGGTFAAATQITVSATTTPAVTTVGGVRSYVLGGLSFGTPYQFWVRSMCTATNTSDWIGPFNFQTLALGTVCADPIVVTSPLPYQDNNNTGNFSDLFDILQSNSVLCGATPATTNYMAGNDVFYRYTATTSGLISIRLTPTSPNASLFVYPSCPTTGACLAGVANATSNIRLINNFAVVAGTSYTIVISSALPTQTVGYTLLIQQENCTAPVGGTPTNITTTSADLSWSNPTGATSWQVAMQPLGASIPTGPGVTVTSNTLYQPVLLPATQYQYWVRSECAPGVFSSWAGPYVFNTLICNAAATCNHTFRMFNASTGGFNGARMEVRQNGILVTTIGATYTAGATNNVVVALCPGVPFELFWTVAGTVPLNCGVSILNTFGQTIFTKPAGIGSVGQQIYTNIVNCATPVCNIAPITTAASLLTTSGATLNWTSPGTTNFDIFVVPFGSPAPTATTVPTYANVGPLTAPFSFATTLPLLADTRYTYYVRVVCAPDPSPWSNGTTFNTIPTCARPLNLDANTITTTSATLTWSNANVSDSAWEILLVPSPTYTLPLVLPAVNPVVGGGTILISPLTAASPYIANGLSPATIYFYYIRTVCSTSDKSTWAGPFAFNTVICDATNTCIYKFILTDSGNNGWNSGRMQIRQNGILVTTIGATILDGGPRVVNVPLCTNVPFDVFWSAAGTAPDEIGLSIQNPFTDVLFTKLPGAGAPLTVLFSATANCTPPTCQKPLTLTSTNVTSTTAVLNWVEAGTSTQWEVYALPILGHTPPVNGSAVSVAPATAPFYLVNAPLPFTITNLIPATNYIYYVRAICLGSNTSTWTLLTPNTFTTKALNDECTDAINLTVNPTRVCTTSTPGNTQGATASAPFSLSGTGCGTSDDDVWFKFTATSNIHLINLNNIVGTPTSVTVNHTLFSGTCATTLTTLYCSNLTSSVAENLVVGTTYFIRVYTAGSTAGQTATFNMCIGTPPPPATNLTCQTALPAVVNNKAKCTLTTPGNVIGATQAVDPLQPAPGTGCQGDALDDVWFSFTATKLKHYVSLLNVAGTTTNMNLALYSGNCNSLTRLVCSAANALTLNYNTFVVGQTYYVRIWSNSASPQVTTFDLCIKSESTCEEAEPLCGSSIADPYLYENTTGITPGAGQIACLFTTPNPTYHSIKVATTGPLFFNILQNTAFTNGLPTGATLDVDFVCWGPFTSAAACAQITFGPCATGTTCGNNIASGGATVYPIGNIVDCSYSGSFTETLSIPNAQAGQYYVILVTNFNGAAGLIRLTQTNFSEPAAGVTVCCRVDLGPDKAVCATSVSLNALAAVTDLSNIPSTYEWYFNGSTIPIPGANGAIYNATQSGSYKVKGICGINFLEDTISVILGPVVTLQVLNDYKVCDTAPADGFAPFDLTTMNAQVLGSLNPLLYDVSYYLTQADATLGINAINTATPFINTIINQQIIFVRLRSAATPPTCFDTKPLKLVVSPIPIAGFSYGATSYCSNQLPNPIPLFATNAVAGQFTATPPGLSLNSLTGTINLSLSSPGIYTVLNTIAAANGCAQVVSNPVIIRIDQFKTATFSYANTSYCSDNIPVSPIFTGTNAAGTFTSSVGLSINATTGVINIAASTPGAYVITNSIATAGACAADVKTFNLTITRKPSGTISYPSVICKITGVVQNVVSTATVGGVFSATAGLSLNATTGAITPSSSTPGTYVVTYTIAAAGGCGQFQTASGNITVVKEGVILFKSGCEGNAFKIEANPVNNSFDPLTSTFIWTGPGVVAIPGTPNKITAKSSGTYSVVVTTVPDGCTSTETITIASVTCAIQQGISPNNDGKNDSFDLSTLVVEELEIFNRYGTKVYNLMNYTNQWIGQSNSGDTLPDGTYFYIIKKKDGSNLTGWIYINK